MIYYTSDTHFSHKAMPDKYERPFSSTEEMNKVIIENWNAKVKKGDLVYHLGDFAWRTKEIPDILKKLNGQIILIKGNHDRFRLKEGKKWFNNVHHYLEIKDNKRKVILFHYPIEEWGGYFRNIIHLHGHIHKFADNSHLQTLPNRYNVNLEYWDYEPATLDEILAKDE